VSIECGPIFEALTQHGYSEMMIFRIKSEEFSIDSTIYVSDFHFASIRAEARFLFQRIKALVSETRGECFYKSTIAELTSMINSFEDAAEIESSARTDPIELFLQIHIRNVESDDSWNLNHQQLFKSLTQPLKRFLIKKT
jgi:hypothetical protein